ncbi:unnamed protein product [Camellia sinensis]
MSFVAWITLYTSLSPPPAQVWSLSLTFFPSSGPAPPTVDSFRLSAPPLPKGDISTCYFIMDSAEAEYAAFEEKVRRTVYIDNLSPQVTEAVLKTALNQFGNVDKVQFIPNYTQLNSLPHVALVEMENSKQAKQIVSEMGNFPFMMSGMPRPVRARAAEMEMFDDRPRKPGRSINFRWLDPQHPDFKVAKELKEVTRQHEAEALFALEQQLADEEKLAEQQSVTLKACHKKFELIEGVLNDGSADRLARRYNMKALNS